MYDERSVPLEEKEEQEYIEKDQEQELEGKNYRINE